MISYYLNGQNNGSSTFNLKAGYNLIEIVAQGTIPPVCAVLRNRLILPVGNLPFNLNYDLANNVDLMNFSQVVLPQLSCDFKADGLKDLGTFLSPQVKSKLHFLMALHFYPNRPGVRTLV